MFDTALSIMALRIITISIIAFSRTTLSIMTFSKAINKSWHSV
jgi:hypothetical protein